jgi:hypothetical protein
MAGEVAVAIPLLRRFRPTVQSDEKAHAQKRLRTAGYACLGRNALHRLTFFGIHRPCPSALQAASYNHVQSRSGYVEQLLISVAESVVAVIDVCRSHSARLCFVRSG